MKVPTQIAQNFFSGLAARSQTLADRVAGMKIEDAVRLLEKEWGVEPLGADPLARFLALYEIIVGRKPPVLPKPRREIPPLPPAPDRRFRRLKLQGPHPFGDLRGSGKDRLISDFYAWRVLNVVRHCLLGGGSLYGACRLVGKAKHPDQPAHANTVRGLLNQWKRLHPRPDGWSEDFAHHRQDLLERRDRLAYELHCAGWKYRQIAKLFDIHGSRARHIVIREAKRRAEIAAANEQQKRENFLRRSARGRVIDMGGPRGIWMVWTPLDQWREIERLRAHD